MKYFAVCTAIVPLLVLTATQSAAFELSSAEESLRMGHLAAAEQLSVRRTPTGKPRRISGVFDLGLTRSDLDFALLELPSNKHVLRVKDAIVSFVDHHSDFFGSREASRDSAIAIDAVQDTAGLQTVVEGHLVWRGIDVRNSDFSFIFNKDGQLISYNGHIRAVDDIASDPTFGPDMAIAIARPSMAGEDETPVELVQRSAYTWTAAIGDEEFALKRLADTDVHTVVWEVSNDMETIVVDEVERQILRIESHIVNGPTKYTQARAAYPTAGTDNALDWLDYGSSEIAEGYRGIYVGYQTVVQPVTPYCFYTLSYPSTDFKINQINDVDSSETTKLAPCAQSVPYFSQAWNGQDYSTSHSYFKQQHVYYWLWLSRGELQGAWYAVSPERTTELVVFIDTDDACEDAAACFRAASTPSIAIDRNEEMWPLTPVHEYGHYFHWTYGSMNSNCNFLSDESGPVKEGVAAAINQLILFEKYDSDYDSGGAHLLGEYGHISSFQQWGVDRNCSTGTVHERAQPFAEAFWEVLNGYNCQTTNCNTWAIRNSHGGGTQIGWTSYKVASAWMREALAYALDVTGAGPTFDDIRQYMDYYLRNIKGSPTVANNFSSVMAHHGID